MAPSKTVVRDRGYAKVIATIRDVATGHVTVGVHGDAGDEQDGTPLAVVAAANEFGTETIPARSFIRSTIDESKEEIRSVQRRALTAVVLGRITPARGLGIIGQLVQSKIQAKIASNIPPPNAPATIAKKGSSRTLIDSGNLRQAITYTVHTKGGSK